MQVEDTSNPANNMTSVGRSGTSGFGQPDVRIGRLLTSFCEHFLPHMDIRICSLIGRQENILWTSDLQCRFSQPDVGMGHLYLPLFVNTFFRAWTPESDISLDIRGTSY